MATKTSSSGQLARAEIVNMETNEVIKCAFNPTEYTFSKQNDWKSHKAQDKNVENLEFVGGCSSDLTITLIFDTYEAHNSLNNKAGEDVRKYTTGIWDLMTIVSKNGKPPNCKFQWGKFLSFEAVVTKIDQNFTFFLSDGTPVRAKLTVTFKQVKDMDIYPAQNPTSGGNPGYHLRTIYEGETLSGIAYEMYGDPTVWRHLAETNDIEDPLHLRPGQKLLITPLPPL